jgi:Tfp pilus assembly PilM family ATPase
MRLRLSNHRLLAIDWDRRTLRVVLAKPRPGGIDLLKAVSVPVPAEIRMDDAESLGAFLRDALAKARAGARRTLLSIPRNQVVLNTLSLPPTPPEELPAIVGFQMAKELPFAAEQATLDFAVAGVYDPKAPSRVLVAAVRNEDLAFYAKVAQVAGLSVERVGLRPYSNFLAVTAGAPELAEKTLLLVEIGPQLTEINIIRGGELCFSRAASVQLPMYGEGQEAAFTDSRISTLAVQDRAEDAAGQQAVSELMVDIIRSFEAYRATDPSVSLDHIVVCGASGLEAALAESLAARFATRAELYRPDQALGLTPQRARELRGFSAALGLAAAHDRRGVGFIDFLHPKKPVSRRAARMRKVPVAVATAALFLLSGVVFHVRFVSPKTQREEALREELAGRKKEADIVMAFKDQVEALEGWIDSRQHWPEVLTTMTELFPAEQEAYVLRADFETRPRPRSTAREALLKMRFRTASLDTVNLLSTRLHEAGFSNVLPGKMTSSEASRDGYKYDTGIDAFIPPRKAPRQEAAPVEPDAAAATPPSAVEAAAPAGTPPAAASDATHAAPAGHAAAEPPRARPAATQEAPR